MKLCLPAITLAFKITLKNLKLLVDSTEIQCNVVTKKIYRYTHSNLHTEQTNMQGGICTNKDLNFSQTNWECPQV